MCISHSLSAATTDIPRLGCPSARIAAFGESKNRKSLVAITGFSTFLPRWSTRVSVPRPLSAMATDPSRCRVTTPAQSHWTPLRRPHKRAPPAPNASDRREQRPLAADESAQGDRRQDCPPTRASWPSSQPIRVSPEHSRRDNDPQPSGDLILRIGTTSGGWRRGLLRREAFPTRHHDREATSTERVMSALRRLRTFMQVCRAPPYLFGQDGSPASPSGNRLPAFSTW